MGIQKILIMLLLLMVVIPHSVLAEGRKIETGFDLYSNLKKLDNPQNPDDLNTAMHTIGYLSGYLDGMVYMQTILFNKVFPRDALTEEERDKISSNLLSWLTANAIRKLIIYLLFIFVLFPLFYNFFAIS